MSVDPAGSQSSPCPEASSSREPSPVPDIYGSEENYASLQMSSAETLNMETGKKKLNLWKPEFLKGERRKERGSKGHLFPLLSNYSPLVEAGVIIYLSCDTSSNRNSVARVLSPMCPGCQELWTEARDIGTRQFNCILYIRELVNRHYGNTNVLW